MSTMLVQHRARDRFERLRVEATILRWWHRLRRRPQNLLPFSPIRDRLPRGQAFRRDTRLVPVRQIVGSLERAHDYDRQLRPLNNNLRDRWVGVTVLTETIGWEPVELVQVGNLYFVVDGHHRVSVARHSGQAMVEANVEVYPLPVAFDPDASLEEIIARLQNELRPRNERRTRRCSSGEWCTPVPAPC